MLKNIFEKEECYFYDLKLGKKIFSKMLIATKKKLVS